MFDNLIEFTKGIKNVARQILRGKIMSYALTKLGILEDVVTELKKDQDAVALDVKRATYKKSKLDSADPDYATKLKSIEHDLKRFAKSQESLVKSLTKAEKAVADQNLHLNDIVLGKVKVDKEELKNLVSVLLTEAGDDEVKKLKVTKLPATIVGTPEVDEDSVDEDSDFDSSEDTEDEDE